MYTLSDLIKFMRESNAIEDELDPDSDEEFGIGILHLNDVAAAEFVLKQKTMNEEVIKAAHCMLAETRDDLKPQLSHPGQYRQFNLSFPKGSPPWTLVEGLMGNFFLDLHTMDSWTAHNRYEQIHPFEDLNGRTGRLLWLWKAYHEERYLFRLGFLHSYYYQSLSHFKNS